MQLLERLQYHIQKLTEEKWDYTHTRGGVVEYVEDPKNDNQFKKFIKDSGNYARCAFVKGRWYFWPAKHSTHDDFIKALGLTPYWNQWHKLEVQMKGNSLELGYQILGDWEEMFREDIKEYGQVSQATLDIIKLGITSILDLHKKYGLKLSQRDLFRMKKLLAYKKPANLYSYDNLYDTDRYVDANKIMSKQHKHDDKSKPRKDRLSRIGYKWPNNPDRLDLDIDLL
jgi:hypothetical protein